MKKAYSMSSIAIVAVIAVAFFLAWMNYQSTAGVDYTERISDNQDALRSKMETVKSISEPILEHASNDAALTIAKAGGGMGTERVWFCDGVRAPPTFHEILYSLSNETLNNLNAYLDDSTDIYDVLNVNIEPYTCSGIYPEIAIKCPAEDYPEACDGWNITGLGGSLYSKEDETTHKYIGDIKGKADYNRFFWMYYRLLEAEMQDSILAEVKDLYAIEVNCEPDDLDCCITSGNLTAIFGRVLASSEFFGHFDEYVTCEVEKDCQELHALSIKITCTDKKYKIPGDDETGERYLTWIIKEMITVGCEYEQCVIIGSGESGGASGEPPANMAGVEQDNTVSDLFFASGTYCNNHMRCFDIDRCAPPFEEGKLCFSSSE
ncbi:MAG: hypothetical protein KAH93_00530 [Candidatus Aenigmarchaeota archaeon]|nr:hypothetical protein [Candidatus Aenigmarchaeota archaeon]